MSNNSVGHSINVHIGETLLKLAGAYPTLQLCIVEMVQNAIDANATRVTVGVDLVEHQVVVLDNGDGVTVPLYRKALQSIGKGIKSDDKIGRFGQGMISPIPLCETMRIYSMPKATSGTVVSGINFWLFNGKKIRQVQSDLVIPYQLVTSFPELPASLSTITRDARKHSRERLTWRTMVRLDGVVSDRAKTTVKVDELNVLIGTKLGPAMRKKKTTVFVKVRDHDGIVTTQRIDPMVFRGQPLGIKTISGKLAGDVMFCLYRARLEGGTRRGIVSVQRADDNTSVTMREFQAQALGTQWYSLPEVKAAIDALTSGQFEGVIKVQNLKLALERTKFELGDELNDTYMVLVDWFEHYGQAIINDAREEQQSQRYTELGTRSLERLLTLFTTDADLLPLMIDVQSLLPGARVARPEKRESKEQAPRTREPGEKRKRVIVKPHQPPEDSPKSPISSFITFAYELLEGSQRLWEYDIESGVLTFNVRHPLWVKIDETNSKHTKRNDAQVMHLQEWLTMKLLLLLKRSDGDWSQLEYLRPELDEETGYYISLHILKR